MSWRALKTAGSQDFAEELGDNRSPVRDAPDGDETKPHNNDTEGGVSPWPSTAVADWLREQARETGDSDQGRIPRSSIARSSYCLRNIRAGRNSKS